jgi:DNA replicative helicase MCM subunit Mcm2 (Cdc46/Mcm family)
MTIIAFHSNEDNNHDHIYSVSEAVNILENGNTIKVKGTIVSLSNLYKVVSKSQLVCENPRCCYIDSQNYDLPRSLPVKNFDNMANGNDKIISCKKCDSTAYAVTHTFLNARTIQLEDNRDNSTKESNFYNNSFDNYNNDRLEVILYENAAKNVIAGEIVQVEGKIYVERKIESGNKVKKLVNILHSNKIVYLNRERIVITPKDIENFHRWKKICYDAYKKELETIEKYKEESWAKKIKPMTFIDRIISMFSPNVIGHNTAKLGILRSIVGGVDNSSIEILQKRKEDNGRRGRIPTLLVGDPGTAKSILGREATKILPNSRYINAQNASGKSLIGIVDKENDSLVLRLGAIVLSKNSICTINEISSLNFEDQGHLIDILEEGHTTLDKYGMHYEIDSPTTVIATSNPTGTSWKSTTVSKDDIPIVKNLLDRFDQMYEFRDNLSETEIEEYTKRKTSLRKRKNHNYNYLKKYLIYVKSNVNPKITENTENRLNKFWINAKIQGVGTNRSYDSIFRIAEAQAKLNLSDEIVDEIANQVMDSLSLIYLQYGKVIKKISNPREIAAQSFFNILKQTGTGFSINEICKTACEENRQVAEYLGNKWSLQNNHKLKSVVDILINRQDIKIIQQKPLVLQYISQSEQEPKNKINESEKDKENIFNEDYLGSNNKSLSDVYDLYDVNNNNGIINQSNSIQHPNKNNTASIVSPKDKVEKIENPETTSYTSYRSDRIGSLHRKYPHSDIWACDNCTFTGDWWFMEKHPCKNNSKKIF